MATASPNTGPVRLPLAVQAENRSGVTSQDSYLANVYLEKNASGSVEVCRRPGYTQLSGAYGTPPGLGFYYSATGDQIVVLTSGVYLNGALLGAVNTMALYWFSETRGTPSYIYLSNGVAGYTISAGVLAPIVDVVYTGTIGATVYGSAYLDATTYVLDVKGNVWGSKNLNNPTVWDALNVIVAQSSADLAVAITKQLIYVVVLKQFSTEFFYGAGAYNGVLTGSPLLPVQNAKLSYGIYDGRTLQSIDDELFWVVKTREGSVMVGSLSGLKFKTVSTPAIERLLITRITAYSVSSYSFRAAGHTYYVIAFYDRFGATPVPALVRNLVYDVYEGTWYEWDSPFVLLASGSSPSSTITYLLDFQLGVLYYVPVAPQASVDTQFSVVSGIVSEVVTPLFDGGVNMKKVLSKLTVLADQFSGGSLQIAWTDDDYRTWSAWRYVNLQEDSPQLVNLGTFKRRAFKFRSTSSTPLRLKAVDLTLLVGSI